MRCLTTVAIALTAGIAPLSAQADSVRPGPPDQSIPVTHEQAACLDSALAPYFAKGQATYPQAKARYLAGLPPNYEFEVSTMLFDSAGHREFVFITVAGIHQDTVYGHLANHLTVVQGVDEAGMFLVLDSAVLDWTIVRPDGTEEGNVVGNYLDTLHGRPPC